MIPKPFPCDSANEMINGEPPTSLKDTTINRQVLRIVRVGAEKTASYLMRCGVPVDLLVAPDEAFSCFLVLQQNLNPNVPVTLATRPQPELPLRDLDRGFPGQSVPRPFSPVAVSAITYSPLLRWRLVGDAGHVSATTVVQRGALVFFSGVHMDLSGF